MDPRPQIGRRDAEDWRNTHGRAAAEAVATASEFVVMPMLIERRFSVMVGMLLRAGLVVSIGQMKCGMGVAADESERQQHNQAAQEQGSLHSASTRLLKSSPKPT
jgi:hypothetical protein